MAVDSLGLAGSGLGRTSEAKNAFAAHVRAVLSGGRAFVERAVEASDRSGIDAVGARDIDQRFAISKPLNCFLPLVSIHLSRSAKTHPAGFGSLPAVARTGFDQVPLERGEASKNSH